MEAVAVLVAFFASICNWLIMKSMLFQIAVFSAVAAVIATAKLLIEKGQHEKTSADLQRKSEQCTKLVEDYTTFRLTSKEKINELQDGHNRRESRREREYKNQINELEDNIRSTVDALEEEIKKLKDDLSRQEIDHEQKIKVLNDDSRKRDTLVLVYQKFRQWIQNQAGSSYSRICFIEFQPSVVDGARNDKTNLLGSGTYGRVYRVKIGDKTVAMKILNDMEEGEREEGVRGFHQEIDIQRWIKHENLVTLIGACWEKFTLMYEYLPNGTLEDRLTKEEYKDSFSWKERVTVATSICTGLVFLHNTKPVEIAHGDLKPENILFDANNVCKLGDFGISRFLVERTYTGTSCHVTKEPKGSGSYMDPEFGTTRRLTRKSDVFALGIILLQLVTGQGASGLRSLILQKKGPIDLDNMTPISTKKLWKSKIFDAKLEWDDKSIEDAIKMLSLGIKCSESERGNRPSLESEVFPEICSMNREKKMPTRG